MRPNTPPKRPPASLMVKVGGWFEASASGAGVAALVVVVILLVGVELARLALA